MKVSITREKENPSTGMRGDYWVARCGGWRNYCGGHFAKTAGGSVAMMYHANEVLSVTEINDEHAFAEIDE